MAQLADAHKVRARLELEKLHKGLVVGLDNKPTIVQEIEPREERTTGVLDIVDVPHAIEMVRGTTELLEDLRNLTNRQRDNIGEKDRENARLTSELDAARSSIDDLNDEVSSLRVAKQELQNSLSDLQDERQKMVAYKEKVEDNLKMLVELIVTSFPDKKTMVAELDGSGA